MFCSGPVALAWRCFASKYTIAISINSGIEVGKITDFWYFKGFVWIFSTSVDGEGTVRKMVSSKTVTLRNRQTNVWTLHTHGFVLSFPGFFIIVSLKVSRGMWIPMKSYCFSSIVTHCNVKIMVNQTVVIPSSFMLFNDICQNMGMAYLTTNKTVVSWYPL